MMSIRTILVPYDFSPYSEAALDAASELASRLDADLHLLHVLRPPAYVYATEVQMGFLASEGVDPISTLLETCRQRLQSIANACEVPPDRVRTHCVEGTSIPHSIEFAAEHLSADLIALGTHGRTGLAHLLMGSVAEATIRCAPCPVLAVPLERPSHVRHQRWEASRRPAIGSL